MLGPWRPHVQFQEQLEKQLCELLPQKVNQIIFHAGALEKVYIMNLDPLKELVIPCYSSTGRPALNQPEIFRAVVLASNYKESISSFGWSMHRPKLCEIPTRKRRKSLRLMKSYLQMTRIR